MQSPVQKPQLEFPFKIEEISEEDQKRVSKDFTDQPHPLVRVGPEKWSLPGSFRKYASQIFNFEARPDDVFIVTLPRSGTTVTQEMIWLICNDLDFETASKVSLNKRFPFMEAHLLYDEERVKRETGRRVATSVETLAERLEPIYHYLENQTSRRFIKTHLPMQLLPRNISEVGAKVVYVARNPKDVAVSYFHFQVNPVFGYKGNFETHADYFMNNLVVQGPYWNHVLDGWSHRKDENVHFMFYEDCRTDMDNSMRKLAAFLGKSLSDEAMTLLKEHLKIDNFKKNPAISYTYKGKSASNQDFIRRGKIGGNPEMTEEMSSKFDAWTEKSLAGSDFHIPENWI